MSPKAKKKSGKKEPNKPQLRARKKKNYKEIKEDNTFDEIDRAIERLGLIIKDVEGDGNCLFRALSDQMFGDESHHSELRQKVCDYIQENSEHFQNFFSSDDETFEKHLERMRNIGTFGDNFELVAFANMNSLDIHIYQDGSVNIMVIKGASLNTDSIETPDVKQTVLHLAYHSWEHYSSIRNISGPFDGLPDIDLDRIKQTLSEQQQKQSNSELASDQESERESEKEDFNPDKPKSNSKEFKALERIERVKQSTGCQDTELIKSILAENQNLYQKAVRIIKKQQREAAKAEKKASKGLKVASIKSVQTKLEFFQGENNIHKTSIEKEETSPNKIRKIDLSLCPQADSGLQNVVDTEDPFHRTSDLSCHPIDNSTHMEDGLISIPLNENKTSKSDCNDGSLQLLNLSISDDTNKPMSISGETCTNDLSFDNSSLTPCTGSHNASLADLSPPKTLVDLALNNEESNVQQDIIASDLNSSILDYTGGESLVTSNTDSTQVCLNNEALKTSIPTSESKEVINDQHTSNLEDIPVETEASTVVSEDIAIKPLENTPESNIKSKKTASGSPLKKKTKAQSKKKSDTSPKKNSSSNDKAKSPPQLSYILI